MADHIMVGGPHDGFTIQEDNLSPAYLEDGDIPLIWEDGNTYYYRRMHKTHMWFSIYLPMDCIIDMMQTASSDYL